MKTSIVLTTINNPNVVIKKISEYSKRNKWKFIVIGDKKTPRSFKLNYGEFYSLKDQKKTDLKFANICPLNNYARKNIGYLIAMKKSQVIIETDDDNIPNKYFFDERKVEHLASSVKNNGWVNIYDFFLKKKEFIWPRGIPLDELNNKLIHTAKKKNQKFFLQQNVCNKNPDVDSIYRIINNNYININFKKKKISLGNSLSTFNSQNTTWFKHLFPLMYLPVTCTMRCTDIWRSIVTLRIMHLNKNKILFNGPTVSQYRNPHDLIKDFIDEIPMFENDKIIYEALLNLSLKKGKENYAYNMLKCYRKLIELKIINNKEISFLRAWLYDVKRYTINI